MAGLAGDCIHVTAVGDGQTAAGCVGEEFFGETASELLFVFGEEVLEADEEAVTIRSEEAEKRVAYPFIRSARTVFEWGGQPKPGKQKHGVSGSRK